MYVFECGHKGGAAAEAQLKGGPLLLSFRAAVSLLLVALLQYYRGDIFGQGHGPGACLHSAEACAAET